MSPSSVRNDCFHCSKVYFVHQSSATERGMFCSQDCQDAEQAQMKEDHERVKKEFEENPADFSKTLSNMGYTLANASSQRSQIQNSSEIVESLFKQIKGIQKSNG